MTASQGLFYSTQKEWETDLQYLLPGSHMNAEENVFEKIDTDYLFR